MSLWYTPPTGTFQPADSRTVGWSQLPNRKASFAPTGPDDDHPASSTGGGTLLDLGSSFNIKGPSSKFNFDVTMNYSDFQFQNVNDLTFNQFQFQQNVQQFMTDIENNLFNLGGWKSTGISGCPTSPANTFTFVSDVDLDTANNRLRFTRQSVKFVDGLLVDNDCDYDFIDITKTDCP
jgi:hypothetical protein